MKKVLLISLLFFINLYTFGQNKIFKRTVQWEAPKTISHYYELDQKQYNKTHFLYFQNANYTSNNTLPYYYELIRINNPNTNIKIGNIKFEKLTPEEKQLARGNENIAENITYNTIISYKRKQPYLQLNLLPLRRNPLTGEIEKLTSFSFELIQKPGRIASLKKSTKFSSESVLKNGTWIKMRIKENGIYKLTYSQLTDFGFSNPGNVKIYGNSSGMLPLSNTEPCQDDLLQKAVYYEKGSDGVFNEGDYILFYAKGPDQVYYDTINNFYALKKHIYSEYNYIFLTADVGSNSSVSQVSNPSGGVDESYSSFIDIAHHEVEKNNLIESGQLWFGEHFDITTSYNFNFDFPGLVKSKDIQLKAAVAARSSASSTFSISAGTQNITQISVGSVNMSSYNATYARRTEATSYFSSTSDNFTLIINYNKPYPSSEGWLDYITLNAERQLALNDNLIFRYYNSDTNSKIVEFSISSTNSSTQVWNVTNPTMPARLTLSSGTIKINAQPGLNEFIAFNPDNLFVPELVGTVNNQNLHSINHQDMIIVSHPDFLTQANEIAALHAQQDDLTSVIVTPQQIYNEFSSGTPDAAAIRNFVRMIYDRHTATDTLKYLLFIGDGSFDHKSITANNINYIPTYQSENSLMPTESFVTDDFFGLLDPTDYVENDNSGLIDLGIGRLPVQSAIQAQTIVEKIKSYINPENRGNWMNSLCFIGDDEDSNLHMRDADRLATKIDTTYPYYFINKIYLDAYPQQSSAVYESYPQVNRLISDEINNGILIFNYTGHGGETGLAHERIVSIDNINSWVNFNKLTIFMTATCEFSRFDNHKYISAGELVLLNPNGGGIALFSTTRLVYAYQNYVLNNKFYDHVFSYDQEGNTRTLGDIIRLAKINAGSDNNKRNFTLLGDPALKIPIARYTILTDSINHNSISNYTDTLKALSKVTFHGHIENNQGGLASSYNGIVYPLVLDKKRTITTLANDGGSTMDFDIQNNIIYKGKASVTNGKFQFSFVVPKDISYNFDNGKITYYSLSPETDAKGYFNNFIIGGSNKNALNDDVGPAVKLYMNDENFVSGGVTNENPKLYAILNDSSGINTVGNGIGHDITATLDNNTNNLIILNDYYESDIDNYQSGKIEYLFSELEDGDHNLKLKVWDVYNNSSEEDLDFIVAESENLAIKNLLNYPNPFTEQTAFYFDHNRPNEDLEVLIQIFTVSGKLVKTINTIINSNAFRSEPINWDGLDDFGDKIGRGVYIYQIKVRTVEGEIVTKIEKLVVLK